MIQYWLTVIIRGSFSDAAADKRTASRVIIRGVGSLQLSVSDRFEKIREYGSLKFRAVPVYRNLARIRSDEGILGNIRAGQLRQLGLAREALTHQAGRLREQTEAKCRSYEILGLCAGAAVLILVV